MPTYDYHCLACGHEFEDFHPISQPALRKCPKCKKPKLERLIGSGAGILFKGGGFYQTDYRSESYKRGESSDKAGEKPASESPKAPVAADSKSEPASGKVEASKTEKGPEKPAGKDGAKASKKKPADD